MAAAVFALQVSPRTAAETVHSARPVVLDIAALVMRFSFRTAARSTIDFAEVALTVVFESFV